MIIYCIPIFILNHRQIIYYFKYKNIFVSNTLNTYLDELHVYIALFSSFDSHEIESRDFQAIDPFDLLNPRSLFRLCTYSSYSMAQYLYI